MQRATVLQLLLQQLDLVWLISLQLKLLLLLLLLLSCLFHRNCLAWSHNLLFTMNIYLFFFQSPVIEEKHKILFANPWKNISDVKEDAWWESGHTRIRYERKMRILVQINLKVIMKLTIKREICIALEFSEGNDQNIFFFYFILQPGSSIFTKQISLQQFFFCFTV